MKMNLFTGLLALATALVFINTVLAYANIVPIAYTDTLPGTGIIGVWYVADALFILLPIVFFMQMKDSMDKGTFIALLAPAIATVYLVAMGQAGKSTGLYTDIWLVVDLYILVTYSYILGKF